MTTEGNPTPVIEATPIVTAPDGAAPSPEDNDGVGRAEPVITPHASRLAEIVAKRQEILSEELDNSDAISGTARDAVPAAPAADAAPVAATAQPVKEVPPAAAAAGGAPPVQTVELIVDGQRIVATPDEVVRLAQKGLGADKRFQEAARLKREAENMMGFQQQQNQQPQHQQPNGAQVAQPNTTANPQRVNVDDKTLKDIAARMNYGSEEEQAVALRDLLTAAASTTGHGNITLEQVQQAAHQQALATNHQIKAQETFETNLKTIGQEFPEVLNSDLYLVAANRVQAMRSYDLQTYGQVRPDIDYYRSACQYTKEHYIKPSETTPDPSNPANSVQAVPESANNGRLERKRAAPQPPSAASRIASSSTAPAAPGASAIVQQMRKQRHQAAY